MATYLTAGGEVNALVSQAIEDWHGELEEHGVTVRTLLAYPPVSEQTGLPTGPALKDRGVEVVVSTKINSLRERVQGLSDATLLLDGNAWKDMPEDRQLATLDHGLRQLEILVDDEGAVKLDDALRPRLRKRPADFLACGFVDVVSRHGETALETRAVRSACAVVQEAMKGG